MDTVTVSKNLKETSEFVFHYRSPHGGIKVMSAGSLLEESNTAYVKLNYIVITLFLLRIVWRGPRKTGFNNLF